MRKVLQERGSGSLPSSTETNPVDYVQSISTGEEADIPSIRQYGYDEEEVLKGLKKLQVNSLLRIWICLPEIRHGRCIFGNHFCSVAVLKQEDDFVVFDGFITIGDGNDSVTYQMALSHLRFKHLSNDQCNKIRPLLQVSARDKLAGILHQYQKLKGFYKGVLDLEPEYTRDEKMFEWLTHGHVSVHEME
ncbi:hypothetical protein Tco_1017135 [Tanacetum coccineum]|uniref:Uncharacterized protein n=1 Tax=Tanacetum coccineum TaxID=301880 RepID=A0ABQ5FRU7_9ASTR